MRPTRSPISWRPASRTSGLTVSRRSRTGPQQAPRAAGSFEDALGRARLAAAAALRAVTGRGASSARDLGFKPRCGESDSQCRISPIRTDSPYVAAFENNSHDLLDPLREDNPEIREMACELLAEDSREIVALATAEDALNAWGRGKFDILITDISLLGMSGWNWRAVS